MNTTNDTSTNGTATGCDYPYICAYKLPCGLCRLTMSECPKNYNQPIITWNNINGMNCAEGKL